jgi:hypothetical protein
MARPPRASRRLLEERAGKPMHFIGYSCDPKSNAEGDNTVWGPARSGSSAHRATRPGTAVRLIVERGGEWKFLSYKGRFD